MTIDALAKQGEGRRAEAILHFMYQDHGRDVLCPNMHTCTSVQNAWTNSKDLDAFDNAKRLL
jgi:hypothetical protein